MRKETNVFEKTLLKTNKNAKHYQRAISHQINDILLY